MNSNWFKLVMKMTKVEYGKNLLLKGVPIIFNKGGAKLKIGENVTIKSSFLSNLVGLYSRTIIVTRAPGAEIEIGDKEIKGMLNPRPFMSKKPRRYILECLDNIYRKIWRKVVLVTQGSMQYLTEKQFEENYNNLIQKIECKLVCCSPVYVDPAIYTEQTDLNYQKANEFLREVSKSKNQKVKFIDLYSRQKDIVGKYGWGEIYYADHFHPNAKGYNLIAQDIATAILNWENNN